MRPMNVPTKLGAYALGLVVVFGAAAGVGNALGPIGADRADGLQSQHGTESHSQHGSETSRGGGEEIPGGLMVSQHGYTLAMARDRFRAGEATPVAFRILGPDGRAVTAYEKTHDKDLHFIAVRRDMTGFQHVHPDLAADGTWTTSLALTPGDWRVFADFAPAGAGEAMTLGADVRVAGDYVPRPLPKPRATAEVDGYTVALDGELVPGKASKLTLTVSRDGRPVTDLQPYLAAYGHLVALRDGDLAYLHVHPAGEPGDGVTKPGPRITFYATAPSPGDYRLFLDFKHDGVVRTAEFTAHAGGGTGGTGGEGHGHDTGDGDHGH